MPPSAVRPRWPRFVVPAAGLAYALVSIGIVAGAGRAVTTYAAISAPTAAAALVPGLALIAVGIVAWRTPADARAGLLAMVAGMVWLAPLWVGWQGDAGRPGPELARSLGMAAAPLLVPLLAHLALTLPTGRVSTVSGRWLVGAGYAAAATVSLGRALFYDPFLDRFCWSNCTDNAFLLHADPELARTLGLLGQYSWVVVGALVAGWVAWRLARASPAARAALVSTLLPAAIAALGGAAYAVALIRDPAENPEQEPYLTIFYVRAAGLALLALGLARAAWRTHRRRSAVARLADDLGAAPPPGSLRAALAQALRDDTLEVAYWLPDSRRYVDAAGRPVEALPWRDRAATSIRRGGEPVAVVVHDRALYDEQRLEREIGSAARLAIDNERLRATLLAQLEDLRASRARIVETGDLARRQLERDLHDGAQQRLLAVTFELRLARAAAESAGDEQLSATLAAAVQEAQAALAELRDIAHGIFPTILDEAGLGPALWSVAELAEVPVTIAGVPDQRLAGGVERAAYLVVTQAVAAATRHDDAQLSIGIERTPGMLVVMVEGAPEDRYDHIADRIGALGGRLTYDARQLRAEIPCD